MTDGLVKMTGFGSVEMLESGSDKVSHLRRPESTATFL